MSTNNGWNEDPGYRPEMANVEQEVSTLQVEADDPVLLELASQVEGAIAFVHFDPSTAQSNVVEALVHFNDLNEVHRGLYVNIISPRDNRRYSGRIIEGPFYNPDALKRDSTPIQFIILNQGQGKALSLPEYHGWVKIEILGEDKDGSLIGSVHRPHPSSPVKPYNPSLMADMLRLHGDMVLGHLDGYDGVPVCIDANDKDVIPRNWLTVGTVGSGKSNTNQVFMEETLGAGFAQVVIDPEGEFILMDQKAQSPDLEEALKPYGREPKGVKSMTVYVPAESNSQRTNAEHFSVKFSSLSPDVIAELTDMNSTQRMRFTFLYDQAIRVVRKQTGTPTTLETDDWDVSRGYEGVTLRFLIDMLKNELDYYEYKRAHPGGNGSSKKTKTDSSSGDGISTNLPTHDPEPETYFRKMKIEPLIKDHTDVPSYGALRKKLRELEMTKLFDRGDAPSLDMELLSEPGHLSVIDMSDADDQQIVNIVIADLLAQMYRYKMALKEDENSKRKVVITIEEAHGFVSREKQDKMEQTLDQLRRIARRGRKRWLVLHFVTQSPQHLPSELFELAVNKIIHQTTGTENLRVLKAAAGTINDGIWQDVPSLGRGRAIFVSDKYPHPILVRIRPAASKRQYTT